jgi:WD40 repeat protein
LCTLTGDFNEVSNVAFSPNSTLAARGSGDKTVRLWDANTGELLRSFIGHNSGVTCVAFTPDGRTLVSGSSDGTVLLWDLGSDPTSNSTVSIVPSVVTSTMPGEQLTRLP